MMKNRILVVENDQGTLTDSVTGLKKLGFECVVYADGKKAAEALDDALPRDLCYDLALLNIRMDDLELLCHMKQHEIPAICIVEQKDTYSEDQALSAGAEDCIRKPIGFWILYTRIEKILERQGTLRTIVSVDGVVIDLASRAVSKNGKWILLNRKEFGVLSVLVRNQDQVLSRQMILDEVWGANYYGSHHIVDAKVYSLRKKLGFQRIIKTVSQCGYIFQHNPK